MNVLCGIRRRPTLPGRFQPSTISVLRLNFCVRDGNRWIPQAIVTGNQAELGCICCRPSALRRFGNRTASRLPASGFCFCRMLPHPQNRTGSRFHLPPDLGFSFRAPTKLLLLWLLDQALDLLVSSSSIRCRTSTDDLSTLSSSRGLTLFSRWQFSSPGGLHA